jgi:hypothetical protein
VVLAAIAAASMWFYVIGILRARQVAEAEAKQIPRGNLSDLYPRWLGARELLLHHRNPYSREVTLEIQEGYYGRRLDSARLNDPKDQQGFAYPVYVVFLLAPVIGLPFSTVMVGFYWALGILTAISVWLWLKVLHWQLPGGGLSASVLLTVGSFAAVQGIKLEQLSLLVAALLAGAAACAASGWFFPSGVLLAVATIKPQLAWLLVAWLLLWAISNWKERRTLVFGFGLVMFALLAGSEVVLPGWLRMFVAGVRDYHSYTQSQSVTEVMLTQILGSVASPALYHLVAQVVGAIAVLACVPLLWKLRKEQASASGFGNAMSLSLAAIVLVVPMYAPYNQLLLLPAILLLVRQREAFLSGSPGRRLGYFLGVFVVGWQWVASLVLTVIYFLLSRERAFNGWTWPFFATFAVPVWIFALTWFYTKGELPPVAKHTRPPV